MSRQGHALAVVVAAALALSACQNKPAETVRAQARSVTVVTIAPHPIEGGIIASGPLVPREELDIFPQLTTYRALQVLVDEGSWVHAGQPLARLDDTLLRAQIAQQKAQAQGPGHRRHPLAGADRSAALRRPVGSRSGVGPGGCGERRNHARGLDGHPRSGGRSGL